ncbi:MAG: TonB family protein [Paludibacter sp.]|nr:TonB family protein [Paludibacter sp.]
MSQQKLFNFNFIKIACALVFAVSTSIHASQFNNYQNVEDSIYSVVEIMPEFPGGERELIGFLNKTINYPEKALKKMEFGKVIVQFVINKHGKVEKPVIIRGVSTSLDEEALRVIGLLPDWIPGEQAGEKVAVYRILPINFKSLSPEELWEPTENTLILLDSVKMPAKFVIGILNPEKLESVNVLKPFPKEEKTRLIDKYGKQAAEGVILITTKKDEIQYSLADSTDNTINAGCKEPASVPEFQGGKAILFNYLADSIQYPFVAKRMKTEGKVFVQFLVNTNGKIDDAKVVRSVDYFLDKEALRVINSMPPWTPGKKCTEKLNILVTMPVTFKLDIPTTEKAWQRNEKTIVLLNGVRLPSTFNLDWLNYGNIVSYKVLQPETKEITKKMVAEFGKDAVNGVILIGTEK